MLDMMRSMLSNSSLDADEISDPTKDQNDEIIFDQPVVRSETTQIEEHPISLCHSGSVVRQPDRYMEFCLSNKQQFVVHIPK